MSAVKRGERLKPQNRTNWCVSPLVIFGFGCLGFIGQRELEKRPLRRSQKAEA
ncbi:MAG: hypothetical protein RLZZ399_2493 [Verrucomicrobiota bacterium]